MQRLLSRLQTSQTVRALRAAPVARATDWIARHRRTVFAGVWVALAGFGAAAFGVAPLTANPSAVTLRQVADTVQVNDVAPQLEALAARPLALYRSERTRDSDTADSLLRRLDVNDPQAALFLRTDRAAQALLAAPGGIAVQVQTDARGTLLELVARCPAAPDAAGAPRFTRLTLQRVAGRWHSRSETVPLSVQTRVGAGTLRSTLFAAIDEAQLPEALGVQLAGAFSGDLDFHHQLHPGDTFSVVYDAWTADGEPVIWDTGVAPRLLGAELVASGRTYSAVWFEAPEQPGEYFTFDGHSKRPAFLASPLAFSRVTSGFEMRLHPISRLWKQHKGMDFGAPAGTPIRTIGGGAVEFAGWQNGYGNVVEVRHSATLTTLYAHLSRIDVLTGQRVALGQHLGAVGATGWATGPHLHFEFRVDGAAQDPAFLARAAGSADLSDTSRWAFEAASTALRDELTASVQMARSHAVVE